MRARYQHSDYGQTKRRPVRFEQQLLPGPCEDALNELSDPAIALAVFEARSKHEETGAPADDPAIVLKGSLLAYSRGLTASRESARRCRANVVCRALSADTSPPFTTLADFMARLAAEIVSVCRAVRLGCEELGRSGKELVASDGGKLPANAAQEWSGTRADYQKKIEQRERAGRYLTAPQRAREASETEPQLAPARLKQSDTVKAAGTQVQGFFPGPAIKSELRGE